MKYAVEEVYRNGTEQKRIFMVNDAAEYKYECTDSHDYYLDVFTTLDEAKQFSPEAQIETGLEAQ